jgi:recombination protein RecR
MNNSSKLIQNAVDQMATLPGIGKKTAFRLILSLLKRDNLEVEQFTQSIVDLRNNIKYCSQCHHLSDELICGICTSNRRDQETICVVEEINDVIAIESTQQYNGLYHVLGGIVSPMDGIGPQDLKINSLIERTKKQTPKEIIFALRATMEGDTTSFYIFKKLANTGIKISSLARGVAVGGELEYADEVTLGRSIVNRTPFEKSLLSH